MGLPERIEEYIQEFHTNGIVVIPNVLSPREVAEVQNNLHKYLAEYGVVSSTRKTVSTIVSRLTDIPC